MGLVETEKGVDLEPKQEQQHARMIKKASRYYFGELKKTFGNLVGTNEVQSYMHDWGQ